MCPFPCNHLVQVQPEKRPADSIVVCMSALHGQKKSEIPEYKVFAAVDPVGGERAVREVVVGKLWPLRPPGGVSGRSSGARLSH